MCDSDEDLPSDISAVVAVEKQVERYEQVGQTFKEAWAKFESSTILFFEHIDYCYRAELLTPFLPNLDVNIEKLKSVCQCKSVPQHMMAPLSILESVHKSVVGGPLSWLGRSVYKEKKGKKIYISIYAKNIFIPLDALDALTSRCLQAQQTLDQEYRAYRAYEVSLQLLVLLWTQRIHLANKEGSERAYRILCDVFAANLKLDCKMAVGFVPGSKPVDIQFKANNAMCRTYDLMRETSPMIQGAMVELKDSMQELLKYLRSKHVTFVEEKDGKN